jgi:hypothetical protein
MIGMAEIYHLWMLEIKLEFAQTVIMNGALQKFYHDHMWCGMKVVVCTEGIENKLYQSLRMAIITFNLKQWLHQSRVQI